MDYIGLMPIGAMFEGIGGTLAKSCSTENRYTKSAVLSFFSEWITQPLNLIRAAVLSQVFD
jgi:hypothetical protein